LTYTVMLPLYMWKIMFCYTSQKQLSRTTKTGLYSMDSVEKKSALTLVF
jgi:hypothetical protein